MHGFLDAIISDPGPPCLMWLPLLHSMAAVEEGNFVEHATLAEYYFTFILDM